ncbi:flagellar basal body-associated protein FliL [Thiomicrospira sp. ALE5]|uniref:flagellar basal body-associated FliL family protein n=1 Tax=Thiomicrospira sp. ALE5 TaxID=748650 RepID=UPI0008E8AA43|nr:flagellar basal body-associated FliL family protein [Thiomicrospira sp. ALE5]SFR59210.1 flagellar FliL protein [Thiomicrospira sp. ALE5]
MADTKPTDGDDGEQPKSKKGLIIALGAVVGLLIIALIAVVFLFVLKDSEPLTPEQQAQKEFMAQFKDYSDPPSGTPPAFFDMKFVVNFQGEGRARFLAIDLQFMSSNPAVIEDMEVMRPHLMNDIQNVLRRKTYSQINDPDGVEELRLELLEIAREISPRYRIFPELIEDVFLTRIVTQ